MGKFSTDLLWMFNTIRRSACSHLVSSQPFPTHLSLISWLPPKTTRSHNPIFKLRMRGEAPRKLAFTRTHRRTQTQQPQKTWPRGESHSVYSAPARNGSSSPSRLSVASLGTVFTASPLAQFRFILLPLFTYRVVHSRRTYTSPQFRRWPKHSINRSNPSI